MTSTFILCLALALAVSARGQAEHIFTTRTGRQVPLSLIQKHFPNPLLNANLPSNVLYEISNERVILGQNITLDFSREVRHPATAPLHSFPVVLNGQEKHRASSDALTIRQQGYTIVIAKRSRKVLVISGRGVHLQPLHVASYPNLLVNTKAFSSGVVNMSDDYEIPPNSDSDQESETIDLTGDEVPPEEDSVEFIYRRALDKISSKQSGSCASGTTHVVELAVVYDNTFCAKYSDSESAATTIVEDIITEANVAYGGNTCIQLKIVHVEAHCNDRNDPYSGFSDFSSLETNPCTNEDRQRGRGCTPGSLILERFRNFWSANRESIARDAAVFFPGFQDGTGVAGVAALGAACSNRFGYGWVENANAFVAAHEIGHILGGRHTSSGLMGATLTPSTPFSFSATSVQQFTDYIDNNPSSSCITPGRADEPSTPPAPSSSPAGSTPPAPSSSPAGSPPPALSSSPAPAASPDVVTPAETCRSGFSRAKALACRRRTLGTFEFSSSDGENIGTLVIRLEQRLGQFRLRFIVSNGATLYGYRGLISTSRPSSPINLGSFTRPSEPTRFGSFSEAANALAIPPSASSCCGQTMFVVYDAIVCRLVEDRQRCVRSVRSFSPTIRCTNSCRGLPASATFTPMSSDNACPTCE